MAIKYGKKVRELMINEMSDAFTGNEGFIFASFGNIKASEVDAFRKKMRQGGSRYFVLKNKYAKLALEKAGIEGLEGVFEQKGAVGVGVIKDDPVAIAKMMAEFAKRNQNFKIASAYLEGRVISADKVKALAMLPPREQLLAMVLSMMNAPVAGLANVLASVLRKVCYAINAIKDKKEGK